MDCGIRKRAPGKKRMLASLIRKNVCRLGTPCLAVCLCAGLVLPVISDAESKPARRQSVGPALGIDARLPSENYKVLYRKGHLRSPVQITEEEMAQLPGLGSHTVSTRLQKRPQVQSTRADPLGKIPTPSTDASLHQSIPPTEPATVRQHIRRGGRGQRKGSWVRDSRQILLTLLIALKLWDRFKKPRKR